MYVPCFTYTTLRREILSTFAAYLASYDMCKGGAQKERYGIFFWARGLPAHEGEHHERLLLASDNDRAAASKRESKGSLQLGEEEDGSSLAATHQHRCRCVRACETNYKP